MILLLLLTTFVYITSCTSYPLLLTASSDPLMKPFDTINTNVTVVQVITVKNSVNWPFYHTAIAVQSPVIDGETYGFYSTYSYWKFLLWGWLGHQGSVRKPDTFLSGTRTIPTGQRVEPTLSFNLNPDQSQKLFDSLRQQRLSPGVYSYINRPGVDNCVSWVEKLLNPILAENGVQVDCSFGQYFGFDKWLHLAVPSSCHIVKI